MWKRLDQVEIKLSFANIQYPIIIQERGETYEDLEAKLERHFDVRRVARARLDRNVVIDAVADDLWVEAGRYDELRAVVDRHLDLFDGQHGAGTDQQVGVQSHDADRLGRGLGAKRHLGARQATGHQTLA